VPKIFISFASVDAEIARRVVASLESSGLSCWLAERDIAPASSYPVAITEAVKNSGAVLLVLTEAANQSPHVAREVEMAFNARRPILPLRIGSALPSSDLQYFLSRSQWLDAGAELDDGELGRVGARIRELLERRAIIGGGTSGSWLELRWSRQPVLIGAAVVAVGIIAFVVWNGRPTRTSSVTPADLTKSAPRSAAETTSVRGAVPPVREGLDTPDRPSDKPAAPAARIAVNPRDGQSYVWIRPGRFIMGCSGGDTACETDEGPSHQVEIRRGFWLARTEVSERQFRARAAGQRPSTAAASGLPATAVSWAAAKSYCQAVGGRLPTEAEWEYAARGGTATRYYDSLPAIAWFSGNTDEAPRPVGGKKPNAFGLYDMLGNVSEWVLDRYYNAYDDTSDPEQVEQPLAGNAFGVARGGSWVSDPNGVRVSRRLEMFPDAEEPHVGFRCASDRI
jgi:formylglycine-generating enzyme required for sulfatase activity